MNAAYNTHARLNPLRVTFRRHAYAFWLIAALAITLLTPPAHSQDAVFQFSPAQTKIEFALDSSLHTVHGDFKLKSSTIRFNPLTSEITGAIIVDATSGESGNDGRDKKMHREILESAKFPDVQFTPKKVTGTLAASGTSNMEVSGQFRLHGQDHEISVPVVVQVEGKTVKLTAHFDIPYVQWGLKSPNTFILRASNTVNISIEAAGSIAK